MFKPEKSRIFTSVLYAFRSHYYDDTFLDFNISFKTYAFLSNTYDLCLLIGLQYISIICLLTQMIKYGTLSNENTNNIFDIYRMNIQKTDIHIEIVSIVFELNKRKSFFKTHLYPCQVKQASREGKTFVIFRFSAFIFFLDRFNL